MKPDSFAGFTRNELVRTIRELHERQTKLLNQIAELQREQLTGGQKQNSGLDERMTAPYGGDRFKFPWETNE